MRIKIPQGKQERDFFYVDGLTYQVQNGRPVRVGNPKKGMVYPPRHAMRGPDDRAVLPWQQ